MAVDMLSYIDRPSPIHRLTGATKLICFILWSSAAMLTYDTGILVFMLAASIVFFQLSNVRFRDISFVVIVLAIFLVINNIAIYIFAPSKESPSTEQSMSCFILQAGTTSHWNSFSIN